MVLLILQTQTLPKRPALLTLLNDHHAVPCRYHRDSTDSIASRASSGSAPAGGGGRGRSSFDDNWDEVGNQDACAMATDNGSGEDWGDLQGVRQQDPV